MCSGKSLNRKVQGSDQDLTICLAMLVNVKGSDLP